MGKLKYLSVIGGQRCGSTLLYQLLDDHPQILMAKPVRPEPKILLKETWLEEGKLFFNNYFKAEFAEGIEFGGEKCTSYIEKPVVADRMLQIFPNCKVIAILRNPVERAVSNYFFSVENGYEKRSLKEVFLEKKALDNIDVGKISVSPFNYEARGFYSRYLESYRKNFGDNLKVLLLEDLLDSSLVLQNLWKFLNIREHWPSFDYQKTKINSSGFKINESECLLPVKQKLTKVYELEKSILADKYNLPTYKFWS